MAWLDWQDFSRETLNTATLSALCLTVSEKIFEGSLAI